MAENEVSIPAQTGSGTQIIFAFLIGLLFPLLVMIFIFLTDDNYSSRKIEKIKAEVDIQKDKALTDINERHYQVIDNIKNYYYKKG